MRSWFQTLFNNSGSDSESNTTPWKDFTFQVLHEIKYNRAPLTVHIPPSFEPYTSLVTEVDVEKKTLMLDKPFPLTASKHLKPGSTVKIACRVHGLQLRFECQLIRMITRRGITGMLAHFPKHINTEQRRSATRLNLSQELPAEVTIQHANTKMQACVANVSHTGLAFYLPGDLSQELRNKMLNDVKVCPTDTDPVFGQLKVQYSEFESDHQRTLVGCQWHGLNQFEAGQLKSWVTYLQANEKFGCKSTLHTTK